MQKNKTNKTLFKSTLAGILFIFFGIVVAFVAYKIKSTSCISGVELRCIVPVLSIVGISAPAMIIGIGTILLSFIDRYKKTSTPMVKAKHENYNNKVTITTLLIVFGVIILIFGLAFLEIIIRL